MAVAEPEIVAGAGFVCGFNGRDWDAHFADVDPDS